MTEQSEMTHSADTGDLVLYDGACRFCVTMTRWLGEIWRRRGFAWVSMEEAWVRRRIGLADGARPREMYVLTAGGALVPGADALVYLARRVWWLRWVGWLGAVPGAMGLFRRAYRGLARHRYCFGTVSKGVVSRGSCGRT